MKAAFLILLLLLIAATTNSSSPPPPPPIGSPSYNDERQQRHPPNNNHQDRRQDRQQDRNHNFQANQNYSPLKYKFKPASASPPGASNSGASSNNPNQASSAQASTNHPPARDSHSTLSPRVRYLRNRSTLKFLQSSRLARPLLVLTSSTLTTLSCFYILNTFSLAFIVAKLSVTIDYVVNFIMKVTPLRLSLSLTEQTFTRIALTLTFLLTTFYLTRHTSKLILPPQDPNSPHRPQPPPYNIFHHPNDFHDLSLSLGLLALLSLSRFPLIRTTYPTRP